MVSKVFVVTGDFTNLDEVMSRELTEERQETEEEICSDIHTPSAEASASTPHVRKEQFYIGQEVWVVLGKESHGAVIDSFAHYSTDDSPAMVTIRWSTLGTYEDFPIDSLRPMFDYSDGDIVLSSHSRRSRKKTNSYAPPPTFQKNSVDGEIISSTKKAKEENTPKVFTAKKRKGGPSEARSKNPKGQITKVEPTLIEKALPGPRWTHKLVEKNGQTRCRWSSPRRAIKFKKWEAACEFEELRKTFGPDEMEAWVEYRRATAGAKTYVLCAHRHDATPYKATKKTVESAKGRQNSPKCRLPGPGWERKLVAKRGETVSHWISPGSTKIKFVNIEAALVFEQLRKKYKYNEAHAWKEHLRVSAGVEDSRCQFAVRRTDTRDTNKASMKVSQEVSSNETRSAETRADIFPHPNAFEEGQLVNVVAGKASHQAVIVSFENCAEIDGPQMATVRYLTWKGHDEVEVNQLRPICYSSKRERKQTDRFAPPSRLAGDSKEVDISQSNQLNEHPICYGSKMERQQIDQFAPPSRLSQVSKEVEIPQSNQLNEKNTRKRKHTDRPLSKKARTQEIGQEKRGKARKKFMKISCKDKMVLLALQEEVMPRGARYGDGDDDGDEGGRKKRRRRMTIKECRDRLFAATGNRLSQSTIRRWFLCRGGGLGEVETGTAPFRVSGKDEGEAVVCSSYVPRPPSKANPGKPKTKKTKKIPSKIEKEEIMVDCEMENEYNELWDYYMKPSVRENEEIIGSGMVLRKKIASCSLLRSKNDVFRQKVHSKVASLHKKGGRKGDILRILKLLREHDSGKLPKDELHQLVREILGPPGTGHGEIEVLDSLAIAALQGCDGKIKENVQDLVEPIASSRLTEHNVKGKVDLTSADALAQGHHPGTSVANNGGHVSRPSNFDITTTNNVAAKTDDSGEISVDIAHSPQAPKDDIDLCWDQEMEPSQHESKLHGGNTSPVSSVTIDSSRMSTELIDLSQDDDLDDGDSQPTSRRQKDARESKTSGTHDVYGSANYHGQISDHNILKNDPSSDNGTLVDLSQESDEDLPSDWV